MPVGLAVGRLDPAQDDLHGLAGQTLETLRQLKDLMGLDLLLLSHVDELNPDGEEEAVASVGDREDPHPVEKIVGERPAGGDQTNGGVRPVEAVALLHSVQSSLQHLHGSCFLLTVVRNHLRRHVVKTAVPFLQNSTAEDRRRLDVKGDDLREEQTVSSEPRDH